jgi:hypothetical protein
MRTFPVVCLAWLALCAGACTHDFDAPFAEGPVAGSSGSAGSAGVDASPDAPPDVSTDHADAPPPDAPKDQAAEDAVADVPSDAMCFPGSKWCGNTCVKTDAPEFGCAADTCTPCALPNATTKCSNDSCAVDTCVGLFADCVKNASDGCETPTNTLENCASCGQGCKLSHAITDCSDGVHCTIKQCDLGYDDCNTNPLDGCEIYVFGDVSNCSTCGHVCTPPNVGDTMKCSNGVCELDLCTPGSADCDKDNVCEVNTTNDVNNCGSCGHICVYANAVASCVAGQCQMNACNSGFGNCNNNDVDGCEVNIQSNVSHCGSCNAPCSTAHGTSATCDQGLCSLTCDTGFDNCNGPAAGASPADDGCEIDLLSDKLNCGGCGGACSTVHGSAPVCAQGKCSLTCDTGYLNCDGPAAGSSSNNNGCEAHKTDDVMNCGTCANVCSSANGTPTCSNGVCSITCNNLYGNCDNNAANGCETSLQSDTSHCGGCATVCSTNHATAACAAGTCQVQACSPGFGNCDANASNACELDTLSSVAHCGTCASGCNGSCPAACSTPHATPKCAAGVCAIATCNAGYLDCDAVSPTGCEINANTDPTHCGTCVTVCNSTNGTPGCSLGSCTISCNSLYGNCDGTVQNGCEKSLASDTSNCGVCGKVCGGAHGTPACNSGVCSITCDSGYGDCNSTNSDGCEIPLNTVNNCGACGTKCLGLNANWTCAGLCVVASCLSSYGNCDGADSNGCESNFLTDMNHCGDCSTACSNPKTCKSGLCSN